MSEGVCTHRHVHTPTHTHAHARAHQYTLDTDIPAHTDKPTTHAYIPIVREAVSTALRLTLDRTIPSKRNGGLLGYRCQHSLGTVLTPYGIVNAHGYPQLGFAPEPGCRPKPNSQTPLGPTTVSCITCSPHPAKFPLLLANPYLRVHAHTSAMLRRTR